ncbi:hypothetical protein ASF78_01290 [Cellulomonas sp. Leaf334]|nr:hypothetical protein ASF78_01290 [Cellulomonas sp. Leaf334]
MVVGTALLVVGGCSTDPGAPAEEDPPSPSVGEHSGAPTAIDGQLLWPDGSLVERTEVDTGAAWTAGDGVDYTVLYTSAPGSAGEAYLAPFALSPDGSLVVGRVPAGQSDGGQWLTAPTVVGLYDGEAFDPFPGAPPVAGDHPRQAFGASVEDGLAAWVETDRTDIGASSWRIFSTGAGGGSRLVARSEDAGGTEVLVGTPMISGGRVYWATGNADEVDLFSRRADGSGTRDDVTTGVGPALGADATGVYVVRPSGSAEQSIERVAAGKPPEVILRRSGPEVAAIVADGGVLVLVTATRSSGGGTIEIVDTRARSARTVRLDGSAWSTSVALCDGRLQWSEAGAEGLGATVPTFVLDVASGDLARIDVDDAFGSVLCTGDRLAWSHLDPASGAVAGTVVARWAH